MMNRTTQMSETSIVALALLAGILLGAIFYGGLWWTVRRSVSSGSSSAWLIGSFVLRAIIAVSGFYLVSQGDWRSLPACLLGFLAARICVTRLIKRAPRPQEKRFVQGTGP
jgi:F1F0 ATPase subunit 2